MDDTNTILYVDMWVGERIQEMKLAGIRRYANMRGWKIDISSERESRPELLAKKLLCCHPAGCIVECSAAHSDLPPRIFGNIPVVYLDCARNLYGGHIQKVMHNSEATTHVAFRELSANNPSSYAVVGYREPRPWSGIRERTFRELAKASGKACSVFRSRRETPEVRAVRLAGWVAKLPRRCAIFAVNDDTAAEVVRACRKCGLRIPAEMTLVGVDNIKSVCEEGNTQISSIQVDFERAGYKAAKMLDMLILRKGKCPTEDWFDPLMVVRRESTRGFGRREPRIFNVVDTIRREACNGLTVRDIVSNINGSRRLFEMRFREAMGHSILDEIQHVRMDKVYFLLSMTDTPISAIASLCGFRSDIALHKFFKSCTGICMREWRKRNRAV